MLDVKREGEREIEREGRGEGAPDYNTLPIRRRPQPFDLVSDFISRASVSYWLLIQTLVQLYARAR